VLIVPNGMVIEDGSVRARAPSGERAISTPTQLPPMIRVPRAGEEILWEIDEHATLFIEPNAARAGAGRITLAVAGLDALLERLAAQGIEHEPIETYSNGVRHVDIPDPMGTRSHSSSRPTPRARHLDQPGPGFAVDDRSQGGTPGLTPPERTRMRNQFI
jgi:hypothetical protein